MPSGPGLNGRWQLPNPKAKDFIDGVEIANNVIDAPGTKAILLYTWTENPAINKNVRITGNTLRGRWGVRRNATGSSWENIAISGNRYEGDPNGPAARVSFVDIQNDTTTGEYDQSTNPFNFGLTVRFDY